MLATNPSYWEQLDIARVDRQVRDKLVNIYTRSNEYYLNFKAFFLNMSLYFG